MSKVTIYHNPACSTSRNALALLRERGIEPAIVDYLKTPPDKATLLNLLTLLSMPARDLIRRKGDLYAELDLANDKWSESELVDFLLTYPVLMERPIVVSKLGARVCRPIGAMLDILPK